MPSVPDLPRGDDDAPPHLPVMPDEVVRVLGVRPGDTVVDGTFGAGGHARLLARALGGTGTYIGVDRDPSAAERFADFAREVAPLDTRFIRAAFPEALRELADEGVSAAAVILDIGVSSMQLDQPERGFAYARDAPLDMRMDPGSDVDAARLVAELDERELARVLFEYGEEKQSRRIARSIVRRREQEPIVRTQQLVDAIRAGLPGGGRPLPGGHPAKRTFQALRIAVNDELGMLDRGLDAAFDVLAPEGRLLVLSFHSLEDRIVKRRFEAWVGRCTCPPGLPVCGCGAISRAEHLTRGAERPGEDEVARNPRSTSTRLRAVRKLDPPRAVGASVVGQ